MLKPSHILRADQFDRGFLDYLCQLTDTIRRFNKSKEGLQHLRNLLPHKRAMLYFTQPSTRTFLSFQSACHILGIQPSEIRDSSTSSELKGESIEDSLKTFSSYVDLIIMRSPVPGLCDRTAAILDKSDRPIPIINAGSGPDEHPTQALLDVYTLSRSFKDLGGLNQKTICMVGDLRRGRTIRSLSKLLCEYEDIDIIYVSPKDFEIEKDLKDFLNSKGLRFQETQDFKSAIASSDAIYMTRIQDEYDSEGESSSRHYDDFSLKKDHLQMIKDDCIIMHPLPRRGELDPNIDSDPRAKYWRQERNGMWTRVAMLTILLGVDHLLELPEL